MKYRSDITTLRALAVMLVVFFHFNIGPFKAGFIGVDIFFVISGFLITQIIISGLNRSTFSFTHFYASRARRLIPALAALLIIIAVLGWFFIAPVEYRRLGEHITSTSLFTSNIQFSRETDYFNPGGTSLWLLHTWSLSVEWQFYLLYPIILVVLYKCLGKKLLPAAIAIMAIVSFACAIFFSLKSIDNSYYLLSSRAWELLTGGLLIYAKKRVGNHNLYCFAGYALIFLSAIFITEEKGWPNQLTILPVIGASLILISNRQSWLDKTKFISLLGLSSYSIYLWHWPISNAINFYNITNSEYKFLGIVLSCLLGYISFKLIEQKKKTNRKEAKTLLIYTSITIFTATLGVVILKNNGFEQRLQPMLAEFGLDRNELYTETRDDGWCFYNIGKRNGGSASENNALCKLTSIDQENPRVKAILFGDSFAGHWDPLWKSIGESMHWDIDTMTTNFCLPAFSESYPSSTATESYKQCLINRSLFKTIYKNYDVIIIGGHWSLAVEFDSLQESIELIEEILGNGKQLIIMPSPTIFPENTSQTLQQSIFGKIPINIDKFDLSSDKNATYANTQLSKMCKNYENCLYIERTDLFNTPEVTNDGLLYSSDGKHISTYGARNCAKKLHESMKFDHISKLGNRNAA